MYRLQHELQTRGRRTFDPDGCGPPGGRVLQYSDFAKKVSLAVGSIDDTHRFDVDLRTADTHDLTRQNGHER